MYLPETTKISSIFKCYFYVKVCIWIQPLGIIHGELFALQCVELLPTE